MFKGICYSSFHHSAVMVLLAVTGLHFIATKLSPGLGIGLISSTLYEEGKILVLGDSLSK